jgi:single-stranded DNA-specific DHH superfamily exonuclease
MNLLEMRESVVLKENIKEPPIAELLNLKAATLLLMHHMNNAGVIGIHFDVDCDGFSAGIVTYYALKEIYPHVYITTNDDRIHGVTEKTAKWCHDKRVSLLIVVDSSSVLDYDMGCDVLVLDHHVFDGVAARKINGHTQVVVSNLRLPEYEPMSGCQVAYEFFRHLYARMETELDTRLAQWVGVSLISDIIDTKNERNQFYVREAFESTAGVHPALRRICSDIDYYFRTVHRSYVTFKLAPYINGISRAGLSASLAFVISDNEKPKLTDCAKARRDTILEEALTRAKQMGSVAVSNLTGVDAAARYTGVAAAKLGSKTGRAAVVFTKEDDIVRGSVRVANRCGAVLNEAKQHLDANGHPQAFGFSGSLDGLKAFVQALSKIELADVCTDIDSTDVLNGNDLQVIAKWNARVNPSDEVNIACCRSEFEFTKDVGKVKVYLWRDRYEVRLLSGEFSLKPRVFVEDQRGLALFLRGN